MSTGLILIVVAVGCVILFSKGHRVGHRGGHLQHYRTTPESRHRNSRLIKNTHRGFTPPPLPPEKIKAHMRAAIRAEVDEASGFRPKKTDVRSRNVLKAHKIEDWEE